MGDFKAQIKTPQSSVSTPKTPTTTPPKVNNTPSSKKNPVKVAEQIKNPDLKPQLMDAAKQMKESLKIAKNGQWSFK